MRNKFAYLFVLFVFLPLVASEASKGILDQKISVFVWVKHINSQENGKIDRCVIIGKHNQLTINDLSEKSDSLLKSKSEFDIDTVVRGKNSSFQMTGPSVMLAGISTQDFTILMNIENKDNDIFQQRIEQCYDVYKENQKSQLIKNKDFFVHLQGINPVDKKIISLKFTEDQVKQIIEKPFAMRPILAALGVAGLIAFLVYFKDFLFDFKA